MSTLILERPHGAWRLLSARDKLVARDALPGAHGYDLAVAALGEARAAGVAAATLLPVVLPTSWMVNNAAPSPVFRAWLDPALGPTWARLLALLGDPGGGWLTLDEAARRETLALLEALAVEGQGAAALSKVLALLCPNTVPLMDDAALWFALRAVGCPTDARKPTAGVVHALPMLDWFQRAVADNRDALRALAAGHAGAPLSPAQVLDRLLWFESWGYHLYAGARRWWWVRDGAREGIVQVHADAHPTTRELFRAVDLTAPGLDDAWRQGARAALAAAAAPADQT